MFTKKTNNNGGVASSSVVMSNGANNNLTVGTSVEGNIFADNDIRIDGKLKGKLNCKGRVIIGKEGSIEGEISCNNAIIEGKFKGTLNVVEILTVKESATVDGEILSNKLNIQPGAIFNGNCTMGKTSNSKTMLNKSIPTPQATTA